MISININKAKLIAHDKRRIAREAEFAPLDAIIAKQIPGKSISDAENSRQIIREKYAQIQSDIDAANTLEEIKSAISILE